MIKPGTYMIQKSNQENNINGKSNLGTYEQAVNSNNSPNLPKDSACHR